MLTRTSFLFQAKTARLTSTNVPATPVATAVPARMGSTTSLAPARPPTWAEPASWLTTPAPRPRATLPSAKTAASARRPRTSETPGTTFTASALKVRNEECLSYLTCEKYSVLGNGTGLKIRKVSSRWSNFAQFREITSLFLLLPCLAPFHLQFFYASKSEQENYPPIQNMKVCNVSISVFPFLTIQDSRACAARTTSTSATA